MVNLGKKLLFAILWSLLVLLPFHVLLTVWLTSEFGHLYIWSAWKEVLIVAATTLVVFFVSRDHKLRQDLIVRRYNQVALGYLAILTAYFLFSGFDREALVSAVFHARFVLAFLAAQVAAWYMPKSSRAWERIIIYTGVISAALAVVQILLLAPDFLTHFGYDPKGVDTSGIPPALHQVAPDTLVYRAQAAMRGPNVLGAFLILPLLLMFQKFAISKSFKNFSAIVILLTGFYLSYSRSAWLGLALALVAGALIYGKPIVRKAALIASGVVVVVSLIILPLAWNSSFVQSVILHRNESVATLQSNEGHLELTKQGAVDVIQHPVGGGLGSAGPASALDGQAKIAENYFLQVGQELGWLGLAAFIAFNITVGIALWRASQEHQAVRVAFLCLIALTLTNLLLHTWTDEPVAISFWVLAGSYLGLKRVSKRS